MENFTDPQLVGLYLEGNQRALNGLVNKYSQTVYRFVVNLTNNSEEAHDITQETFIKVWRNLKKFDLNKNFKTWLFTIAQRTAIDYLRKKKNINFSALDNKETDTAFDQNIPDEGLLENEIFEQNENILLIKNALDTLSVENKTIILLHNGEEMTFEEIAETLDKPMNTVKSQYRRTLLRLKKYIIEQSAPKAINNRIV